MSRWTAATASTGRPVPVVSKARNPCRVPDDTRRGTSGAATGPPSAPPLRIVLIYAVFAGAWIVVSDEVLRDITVDPNLLTLFAVLKGLLFVAVTSLILLVLIRGYFTRISEVVRELKVSHDQIEQSLQSTVEILGKVTEIRDPYTAGHQRRVRELAVAIAEKMGMPEAEIADIGTAAAVHDMGKISVPAEILTKPGALSPIEFELIRAHSQGGFDLLSEARMPRNIARARPPASRALRRLRLSARPQERRDPRGREGAHGR